MEAALSCQDSGLVFSVGGLYKEFSEAYRLIEVRSILAKSP